MKKILFLLCLLFSLSASASIPTCYGHLLHSGLRQSSNLQDETAYFYLNSSEFFVNREDNFLSNAQRALSVLAKKVNCRENEIRGKSSQHKDTCNHFGGKSKKEICVLERDVGIFVVTLDYLEGVSIVFQRWD